jgi:tRNA (guanine-N7-)-methyltransferase
MHGNSRSVSSNQEGIHEQLESLVKRYLTTQSRRPVQPHTETAFSLVTDWMCGQSNDIILDSCCGIGESTARLASLYPDHKVIGIDKSAQRVAKHRHHFDSHAPDDSALLCKKDNYCVVRADVIDFWRLIRREQWRVDAHYLLYPNPYPKASQIQKRWYASAPLQDLLLIQGRLQVRSNWRLYLQEFQQALNIAGSSATLKEVNDEQAMTPFERKYQNSGQTCWQLDADLTALNPQSWQWDD